MSLMKWGRFFDASASLSSQALRNGRFQNNFLKNSLARSPRAKFVANSLQIRLAIFFASSSPKIKMETDSEKWLPDSDFNLLRFLCVPKPTERRCSSAPHQRPRETKILRLKKKSIASLAASVAQLSPRNSLSGNGELTCPEFLFIFFRFHRR